MMLERNYIKYYFHCSHLRLNLFLQKQIKIHMKTIDEIRKLLDQHKPMLKAKYNIKNIGLFGSIVRGDVNPDSDVDILVEFEKPIGLDFVSLADELEEILGVKIDLVTPNAIKPTMFEYIKQDLIYV